MAGAGSTALCFILRHLHGPAASRGPFYVHPERHVQSNAAASQINRDVANYGQLSGAISSRPEEGNSLCLQFAVEWVLIPIEPVSHRARGWYQPRRTEPGCHSLPSPWSCGMQAQTCTPYTKTTISSYSRRHNEPRTLLSQIARRSFRVGYIKLHKHVSISALREVD